MCCGSFGPFSTNLEKTWHTNSEKSSELKGPIWEERGRVLQQGRSETAINPSCKSKGWES